MTIESDPYQTSGSHASTDNGSVPNPAMRWFMVRCTLVLVVVFTLLAGGQAILKSKKNGQSPEIKALKVYPSSVTGPQKK